MKVKVLFFASLAQMLGKREEILEIAEGTTLAGLREKLFCELDSPASIPPCQFSVNEEIAPLEKTLNENDVVALLPPFAGG